MRRAPRAGSSGPAPGRRSPRPADPVPGDGASGCSQQVRANSGSAVSGAPAAPSGPPCFSSDASSEAARRTTGAGTPASSATCTPQERPAAPAATSCRNTTLPFHSFTRMVCGFSRGSRSASSASSWKCVAKMVRQRIAECSASSTAQAMARPSSVAVPRPISSTTTSERGPAWCRMAAVSVISTMKVERPRARSSAAPTRENRRSTTPIVARFRRHRQAGLGEHDDQRVLPQEGRLAGHVGTGEQQHTLVRREVAVVRHELRVSGERRLHHRMAAGVDQECIVVGDQRTAPRAGFGELRRRLDGVEQGQRVGAGGQGVGVRKRRPHQVREHARSRAAARSPASEMRRSRSESSGVVKRAPLAMPWRSVSSGMSRSFSTAAAGASMT